MADPYNPVSDPTARGDMISWRMRDFYEANRESWWERRKKRWTVVADNLMLGLMQTYESARREYTPRKEINEQPPPTVVEDEDPPTKWLVSALRELAREHVADQRTVWIGERDPKKHICWTAADRLEAQARS